MIIDEDVYLAIQTNDFLEHYGVKGMRWGVRKKPEAGGDISPDLKEKLDQAPKPTAAQQKRIREAQKKHDAHYGKSEAEDPKGWRPTGKQIAIAAVGAIVVAAIIYKVSTGSGGSRPFSIDAYKKAMREAETPSWVQEYSGKKMKQADFKGIAQNSADRIWGGNGGYVTKDLFDQPERTFKSGHEFFRVSHRVETSFKSTTFATASKEDASRYFLGWKENTTNLISFKAKEEIKVPDLHTTLEAVREAKVLRGEKKIKPKDVITELNNLSGSDFSGTRGAQIVNVLKSKGYDGIVDYMDVGVYGKDPMVLFSPTKFTDKVTTLRENVDVKALRAILTDIPNRR